MTQQTTAICIAGMHRAGTSMVTRLLNVMGMDLGEDHSLLPPSRENPAGYWERRDFVAFNDTLLSKLGAGWDVPELLPTGFMDDPIMDEARGQAHRLISQFEGASVWGWKDPRNSFLSVFWQTLVPELRLVVPLRNPVEVAASLAKRGQHSPAFSYRLWLQHYAALLQNHDAHSLVVTHYDSYFHNPTAELARVWESLGLIADPKRVADAVTTTIPQLRHTQATIGDLHRLNVPPEVVACYMELCGLAGEVYAPVHQRELNAVESQKAA